MRGLMRSLVAALCLLTFACHAQDNAKWQEGKHYSPVRTAAKPTDPKRITVEEFFWYGCQHCFHFDPSIEQWKQSKPADVDFVRVPASLGRPEGIVHQKTFYAAQALGVGDKIHKPLFDGIHVQHLPLFTQDAIRTWFNTQTGVMPEVFDSTYTGFAVDSGVRRADQLAKDYGILSVPTVVVGGKYLTTAQMAGGFPQMIEIINFLVDKVRKEQK